MHLLMLVTVIRNLQTLEIPGIALVVEMEELIGCLALDFQVLRDH